MSADWFSMGEEMAGPWEDTEIVMHEQVALFYLNS